PTLGVQRGRQGLQSLKVGGVQAESIAELSRELPLLLINDETFAILEGAPSERRRFLDWGVFHVKHEFIRHWRSAQLALKQRNQLLRAEAPEAELAPWTEAFAAHGHALHAMRGEYFELLHGHLSPLLNALMGAELAERFRMSYAPGWDVETSLSLAQQLDRVTSRDRQQGHTTLGPHRADLKLRVANQDAASVLSRGQMKLLICALRIGQASLLKALTGISCVVLVDDLPAELDSANRARVCGQLQALGMQAFLTTIEAESLLPA